MLELHLPLRPLLAALTAGALALGSTGCSCDDDDGHRHMPDAGDGGEDGATDAAADANGDAATGEEVKLTLGGGSSASADEIIWTVGDDDLPRTAARFEPPSLPFEVTKIVYRLSAEDFTGTPRNVECDVTSPHSLGLGQRNFVEPPANNSVEYVIEEGADGVTFTPSTVTLDGNDVDAVTVEVVLETPFVVTQSSLFVVHLLSHDLNDLNEDKSTCLFLKNGTDATRDRNYVNIDTPVDYLTLYQFNDNEFDEPFDQDLQVEVYGRAAND